MTSSNPKENVQWTQNPFSTAIPPALNFFLHYLLTTTSGTIIDSATGQPRIYTVCAPSTGDTSKPIASSELSGNYYNFYAATAGSGHIKQLGDAPDSICPSGWRLPSYSGSGSFYNLVLLYLGREGTVNETEQVSTALQFAPLEFTRTGSYYWSSAALNYRGSRGYFWSGRSYSSTGSYYLVFNSTGVGPQNGVTRGYGFSLRCLAR